MRLVGIPFSLCLAVALITSRANGQSCLGTFDPNKDHFTDPQTKVTPTHAKNFEVTYKNFLKEVTIRTPGAGDQKYTLHLCNSSGTDRSIGVPVNKLAVGRTDVQSLAFLERLGHRSKVQYLELQRQEITSPCMLLQVEKNDTQLLPVAGDQIADTVGVGFGSGSPSTNKLPWISIFGAMNAEATALARAEWIKFFALFTNNEREANAMFKDDIEALYTCQMKYAQVNPETRQKRVAWIAAGNTNTPADKFSSYDSTYTTNLIKAAGVTPVELPQNSNQADTFTKLRETDLLIDSTSILPGADYRYSNMTKIYGIADQVNQLPFAKDGLRGKSFRPDYILNAQGYDDFMTLRSHWAQPEYLLNDLVGVVNDGFATDAKFFFFRNLAESDEPRHFNSSDCDASKPATPQRLALPSSIDCSKEPKAPPTKLPASPPSNGKVIATTFFVVLAMMGGVLGYVFRWELRDLWEKVRSGEWKGYQSGPFDEWARNKGRAGAIELA